jgi:hypothetical protein
MKTLITATGLVALLALGACTTAQETGVTTSITTAEKDATIAVNAYQASLGAAEVASIAYPSIAPALAKIEAVAGPLIAELQPLETDTSADVATVEALVAQLNSQATQLIATAAPAIKVVAAK